jgi:exodeoxyribonuclease V gamma subunit
MLRLVYSNRTEELLAELATRVRAEQRGSPLAPVRVIVPNACTEAYVRLGIAREKGIAANLDVLLLTRFASSLASPGTRVADAESLAGLVLTLLLDDAVLARDGLAPVQVYLRSAGTSPDAVDLRRVQLAARLGRIFEEYTYSRADLLEAWTTGPTLDGMYAETERWQRALYLAIFGDGGLATKTDPRVVTLTDAVASLPTSETSPPGPVHVFGFAHVAPAFYGLFQKLARAIEVVVYSLSPCEGFWEDVDRRDPAPLHLWGRPGRDHVRVLNALSGFDHDDRFVDPLEPGPRTLLHRLQSDLLRRASPQDSPGADESFLLAEHASVRRELEAVASGIWDCLEKDASLRFDEIAVLVPPAEAPKYAAHLPTVFREAHDVPFQMMGMASPTPSPIAQAIDLLLALPLGRFSRGELLRLVVHPSVAASFAEVDPARWTAWCESLGIVHGADRADHEGTYIERDILNWDQGLRRLALGAFMVGDVGGEAGIELGTGATPFLLEGEAYAPLEVTGSELRDAAAFGLLSRSLIEDAKFARAQTMTLPEWAELLCTLVSTYVTPVGPEEPEELTRALRRLQALGEERLSGKPVGYRIAYELATRRLGSGPSGSGSGGVVVSTIVGLRAIPFRVVFACGMGEGRFPSSDGEDPLDLRWARRRGEAGEARDVLASFRPRSGEAGDVPSRDRDKYAFLELLLSVRDRLVLSYVSRDALTGDALAPSSVVQELLHTLGGGYVRDAAALRQRHPLRRWDPAYYPRLFPSETGPFPQVALPEARAEAETLALRRWLEGRGERLDVHEVRSRAEANEPGWKALTDHLRLAAMPQAPAMSGGKVVVPMHALVKFLEFPLHGWARFRFGLGELEDEDVLARESEPFETELREETLFLRGVLLDAKRRCATLEDAYDAAVRARGLRGAGPSGAFARGERTAHVETLGVWRSELEKYQVPIESLSVHRFGRGGERADSEEVHDPLSLELAVVDRGTIRILQAEIVGRTLPFGADESTSITLAKRADADNDEWTVAGRRRTLLRSFVDHAILSASKGDGGERSSLIVVATPDGPFTERITLPALVRDNALVWLRGLVQELLAGSHDYFFPFEAVFVHRERGGREPLGPVLAQARDKLRDRGPTALRSAYGPVPRPHEYRLPDEDQARAMVASRFGPIFDGWMVERT